MLYPQHMNSVTVIGSINLDLVASAPRLPVPGETVTDAILGTHPGGKGANQALAAGRMGANVSLIGRVGSDANADQALALLREGGVDLEIVVAPGANRLIVPEDVQITDPDAVICQLEIPLEVVIMAARRTTGLFCLNAAPVRPLPDELIEQTDLLVVNEIEAEQLGDRIHQTGGLVAITLGRAGARLHREGREVASATPPTVDVVDTVGAGDTFVGAIVASLVAGHTEAESLQRAVIAGALATTVRGAQPSAPTLAMVEDLL
jgi:ribokinase